jgi:hypothetical protein
LIFEGLELQAALKLVLFFCRERLPQFWVAGYSQATKEIARKAAYWSAQIRTLAVSTGVVRGIVIMVGGLRCVPTMLHSLSG